MPHTHHARPHILFFDLRAVSPFGVVGVIGGPLQAKSGGGAPKKTGAAVGHRRGGPCSEVQWAGGGGLRPPAPPVNYRALVCSVLD